jgi:hypothetical protein
MPDFLALIDRWNPGIYGCSSNECVFLDYFSTKYYLIWTLHDPSDLWNEYSNFPQNLMMAHIWNNYQPVTLHFAICKQTYSYRGRTWVNINYSFYNFVKKVKNYYKSKLAFYKNPKNLRYRQIHGKYPHFSLPKH